MGEGKHVITVALKLDVDDELESLKKKLENVMSDSSSNMTDAMSKNFKTLESKVNTIKKTLETLNKTPSGSSEYGQVVKNLQTQFKDLAGQISTFSDSYKKMESVVSGASEISELNQKIESLSASVKTISESIGEFGTVAKTSSNTALQDNLQETRQEAEKTAEVLGKVTDKVKVYKNQTDSAIKKKDSVVKTSSWTEYSDFFQTITKKATINDDGTLSITSSKIKTNFEALEKEITKVDKKIIQLQFDMGTQDDVAKSATQNQIKLLREYLELLNSTRNAQASSSKYLSSSGQSQAYDASRSQELITKYSEQITKISKSISELKSKITSIDLSSISSDYAGDLKNAENSLSNLSSSLEELFQKIKANNGVLSDNDLLDFFEKYKSTISQVNNTLDFKKVDQQISNLRKSLVEINTEIASSGSGTDTTALEKKREIIEDTISALVEARNAELNLSGDSKKAYENSTENANQYNQELIKIAKSIGDLKEKITAIDSTGFSADYADDLKNAEKSLGNLSSSLEELFHKIKDNNGVLSDNDLLDFFDKYRSVISQVNSTLNFQKVDKQISDLKNSIIEIDTEIATAGKTTDVEPLKKKKEIIKETISALVEARNAELNLSDDSKKAYENSTKSLNQYNEEIIKVSDSLSGMREKLSSFMNDSSRSSAFKQNITSIYENIGLLQEKLSSSYTTLQENPFDPAAIESFQDALSKVVTITQQYNNVIANSSTSSAYAATREDVQKLDNQISGFLDQNTAAANRFKQQLYEVQAALRKVLAEDTSGLYVDLSKLDLSAYVSQVNKIESEVKSLHQTGNSFFTSLRKQLQSANAQFIGTYFSIQDIIRYAKEIFDTVTEIDSALTELRKVSDATTQRLVENFETSAETAKELGASVSDVINLTADWSRLGYSVDEAEDLAKITTLFKNVSDDISADDASEYMISTLQGFQKSAEEAESIVDAYNEVANNYAIDTAGIGEALERSAASFNASNTSMEKAIALVTATNEVIQDPESVGTLWKTDSLS